MPTAMRILAVALLCLAAGVRAEDPGAPASPEPGASEARPGAPASPEPAASAPLAPVAGEQPAGSPPAGASPAPAGQDATEEPVAKAPADAATGEAATPSEPPTDATAGDAPAESAEAPPGSEEMQLDTGEPDDTGEEAPPKAAPKPRPKPKPAPPKPKPKPAPKPAPAPEPPKSPFEYRMIEDFEKCRAGETPGLLHRAGLDPKPQFSVKVVDSGFESARSLMLSQVPVLADSTAWSLVLPKPVNLERWRGLSVRVKAAQPVAEFRIAVAGGAGYVFRTAAVGPEWTEIRLDFAEDEGRGRFDPAKVREILLTAAHDLGQPVDFQADSIAAWKERVPSSAVRFGLNVPPWSGPLDLRAEVETVNCAGRLSAQDGYVLAFWSGPLPYLEWKSMATWRDLPRGLPGAVSLVAMMKASSDQSPVVLKIVLGTEGGERYFAVREAPVEYSPVEIPMADFVPEGPGDGKLAADKVNEWSLEIMPSVERQYRGTIYLKEFWARGKDKPVLARKPAVVTPPRSKPQPPVVQKPARPKPKPKPAPTAPASEPAQEEGSPTDMQLDQ